MRDFIVILPVLMFMFLLFRSPAFRDDKTGDYYKREVSGKTEIKDARSGEVSGKTEIKDARSGKIYTEAPDRRESGGWERIA